MKRQCFVWAIVAGLLLPLVATSPAWAITYIPKGTAAYLEGNPLDPDEVDTYPGVAGDGWAAGWQKRIDKLTSNTVAVGDISPLAAGTGKYLSCYMDANATDGLLTVGREYTPLAIDPAQVHTISFLFRVDENLGVGTTFFNDGGTPSTADRYELYGSYQAGLAKGVGTNSTWIIGAYGASMLAGDGTTTIPAGNWIFKDYISGSNYQYDTGIALANNTTYSFAITLHNSTYTWDATVTNLTTSATYSRTGMGYRNSAATYPMPQFFGKASASNDNRQFSIDSLVIAQSGYNWVGGMNQVAAHFDGGGSSTVPVTNVVDAYTGMAGNGWNGAWGQKLSQATLTANVVASGDPGFDELQSGTGAYLSLTAQGNLGTTEASAGVGRDYSCINVEGVDWTKPHIVRFKLRIDEDVDGALSTFTGNYDRYAITDSTALNSTTHPNNTWAIAAYGGENASTGGNVTEEMVGKWCFADGDGAGTIVSLVNSGIALTTGGVYDFTILVDPTDKTYDVAVSDGTAESSATGLHWRTSAATVGGFLNFVCGVNSDSDVRAWSIDEIIISTPPTVPGDASGDGDVDDEDAAILAQNWGANGQAIGWSQGDFNGDHMVNAADAAIQVANWGYGASEGHPVPEPATLATLVGGLIALATLFGRPKSR